jgi:hypothetical protein
MKLTINGKEIKLKGTAGVNLFSHGRMDKIGFAVKYLTIKYDENKKELTLTEKDGLTHKYEKVESCTEYEKAVYVYAYNAINGNKSRIVLDK